MPLEVKKQERQKTTTDTTTTKSNSIDESKLQNVAESQSETIIESEVPTVQYKNLSEPTDSEYALLKTNEIVFDSTPTAVKTESAVIAPVDSRPMVKPTPAEVELKRTEAIVDLKPNHVVFVQSTESTRILPPSEETPNQSPQLGRKKTVKSINGTVHVQQESEDQPVRTEPIDIQLSTYNSQETTKANNGVIRVVKDQDKIIIGIGNTQAEDDEEKIDIPELNPITTVAELAKALDYIQKITLSIRLNEELGMENNLENGEQTVSEIDIVVSNEILELIEAIVDDYYSQLEPQIKDEGVINRQTVTFSTFGENKKQFIVDVRQLLHIQKIFNAIDLGFDQTAQFEEEKVFRNSALLHEIELLVQDTESKFRENNFDFGIIVSQELMTFLEEWGKIIEETENNNPGIASSYNGKKETEVEQYIAISSSDRKMKIELLTLKKLMKLLKKKRRIESEQAPEEIKGNIKTFQSGNNIPIWFIYQAIIFLLAFVDNQRSDYNPKHSKVLYASTKQEIVLTSDKLTLGI